MNRIFILPDNDISTQARTIQRKFRKNQVKKLIFIDNIDIIN